MKKTSIGFAACLALGMGFSALAPAADEEAASKCGATSSTAYQGGTLTIEPGQVLCLRVSMTGGKLSVSPASADTPKDEVLVLDLSSEGSSTMLVVENGTPLIIKYSAKFQVPDRKQWYPTSICPVHAGISGIEQWPHAIQVMRLSDFRVLPKDAELTCD